MRGIRRSTFLDPVLASLFLFSIWSRDLPTRSGSGNERPNRQQSSNLETDGVWIHRLINRAWSEEMSISNTITPGLVRLISFRLDLDLCLIWASFDQAFTIFELYESDFVFFFGVNCRCRWCSGLCRWSPRGYTPSIFTLQNTPSPPKRMFCCWYNRFFFFLLISYWFVCVALCVLVDTLMLIWWRLGKSLWKKMMIKLFWLKMVVVSSHLLPKPSPPPLHILLSLGSISSLLSLKEPVVSVFFVCLICLSWVLSCRFVLLDESFLVENRLTLRAMWVFCGPFFSRVKLKCSVFYIVFFFVCRIEFAVLMGYFYICDRTDVFNSSKKVMMMMMMIYLFEICLLSRFGNGLCS